MPDRKLKASTVRSLGTKLDELRDELSPDEAAVLTGLLGLAGAALEEGHGGDRGRAAESASLSRPADVAEMPSLAGMLEETFRPGGTALRKPEQLADSIGVGWLCVSWSKDYSVEEVVVRASPEIPLSIPGLRRTDG